MPDCYHLFCVDLEGSSQPLDPSIYRREQLDPVSILIIVKAISITIFVTALILLLMRRALNIQDPSIKRREQLNPAYLLLIVVTIKSHL